MLGEEAALNCCWGLATTAVVAEAPVGTMFILGPICGGDAEADGSIPPPPTPTMLGGTLPLPIAL